MDLGGANPDGGAEYFGDEQKLTLAFIERKKQEYHSYYSRMVKEITKDVELYNQEFDLDVPDGFHKIKSPTTRTMCDRAADRIGAGRFQNHMEPRNGSPKEANRIERKEKAASVLPYLMRKRMKFNPYRAAALHAFNRGAFVFKIQVDMDALKTKPVPADYKTDLEFKKAAKLWTYKAVARFPVTLDVRPIENIWVDPETDGDNMVIEHYMRPVGDIKKNYPNWDGWANNLMRETGGKAGKGGTKKAKGSSAGGYTDDQRVNFVEVWTQEQHAVLVDGMFVGIGDFAPGPIPNPFGRPPYFMRYAGFGDPAGLPHNRCVSILRAIRDTSKSMSRMFSILDTIAENEAYGATNIQKGDSGAAEFSIGPGSVNEMDFPEKVVKYTPTGVNPSLLQALNIMQSVNESGSVPAQAIGQSSVNGRGPTSGVQSAIETGQASMIIDPVKSAIEDAHSEMVSFIFYVFDAVLETELPVFGQVGEDLYVQMTLGPDDIDNHYGPIVSTLMLRAPEDDYSKYQLGIQAMTSGFPPEFVMEKFFGIEDPKAMVRDMMAKQIAYSPQVREQYLIPRLLERLKATDSGQAEMVPGQRVPAPAAVQLQPQQPGGMPMPPQALPPGPGGPQPNGPMPAPQMPSDAMARANMGMAGSGPSDMGGAPVGMGSLHG